MMALPELGWVRELFIIGGSIGGSAAAAKLAIGKRAVEQAKVVATIEVVDRHEGRIQSLESTGIRVEGRLSNIENSNAKMDGKLDRVNDTAQQILGEMRAREHRR